MCFIYKRLFFFKKLVLIIQKNSHIIFEWGSISESKLNLNSWSSDKENLVFLQLFYSINELSKIDFNEWFHTPKSSEKYDLKFIFSVKNCTTLSISYLSLNFYIAVNLKQQEIYNFDQIVKL